MDHNRLGGHRHAHLLKYVIVRLYKVHDPSNERLRFLCCFRCWRCLCTPSRSRFSVIIDRLHLCVWLVLWAATVIVGVFIVRTRRLDRGGGWLGAARGLVVAHQLVL